MYEALGLTRNPFAYGDDDLDPGGFLDHLAIAAPAPSAGRFLQLIGERGAGKTTYLRQWHSEAGGEYYHVDIDVTPRLPIGPLVYWDEADRVSRPPLKRALTAAFEVSATVVVGTHVDLAQVARRVGFDVETVTFGRLEVEVIAAWAHAHLERVAIGDAGFELPAQVLSTVTREAGSSLRAAGDLLHIFLARQARVAHAATVGPGDRISKL